jgi:hypothetical protein
MKKSFEDFFEVEFCPQKPFDKKKQKGFFSFNCEFYLKVKILEILFGLSQS